MATVREGVMIALSITTFMLLLGSIVMQFFNTAYNYQITGLAVSTTQGLILLPFVLALIGYGLSMLGKIR